MSEWSQRMSSGAETARVATLSTIGTRVPDWTGNCSSAYSSPWEEVTFNTRPPPSAAP
jgi:hypothetical protein